MTKTQLNLGTFTLVVVCIFIRYAQPYTLIPAISEALLYYLFIYTPILGLALLLTVNDFKNLFLWNHVQMRTIWLLMGWMILLSLVSINKVETIKSTVGMLLYVPLILAIVHTVTTTQRLQILIKTIVLSAVFVGLHGILVFDGLFFTGLGEYLENPNGVSLYFSILLPFCYLLISYSNSLKEKALFIFATVLSLYMIVLSASRAGVMVVLFLVFVYWLQSRHKILFGVLGGIALVGVIAVVSNDYKEEVMTVTDTEYSPTTERFDMWKYSLTNLFSEKPWGWGVRNTQRLLKPITGFDGGNHSLYITFLTDLGILGFLLFARLCWINVKDLWGMFNHAQGFARDFTITCFAAFGSFMITGLVEANNYYPHMWVITALIMVGSNIYLGSPKGDRQ